VNPGDHGGAQAVERVAEAAGQAGASKTMNHGRDFVMVFIFM
jgi:hypothetical protein